MDNSNVRASIELFKAALDRLDLEHNNVATLTSEMTDTKLSFYIRLQPIPKPEAEKK